MSTKEIQDTVWEHPIQLIQSADSIYFSPNGDRTLHHHLLGTMTPAMPMLGMGEVVSYDEIVVKMQPYIFDFEKTLGWSLLVRMGLCPCGTLFIWNKCQKRIIVDDSTHRMAVTEEYL